MPVQEWVIQNHRISFVIGIPVIGRTGGDDGMKLGMWTS